MEAVQIRLKLLRLLVHQVRSLVRATDFDCSIGVFEDFPKQRSIDGRDTTVHSALSSYFLPDSTVSLNLVTRPSSLTLVYCVCLEDVCDVERCRSAVHNGVQSAELQPTDGRNPDSRCSRCNRDSHHCRWRISCLSVSCG